MLFALTVNITEMEKRVTDKLLCYGKGFILRLAVIHVYLQIIYNMLDDRFWKGSRQGHILPLSLQKTLILETTVLYCIQ